MDLIGKLNQYSKPVAAGLSAFLVSTFLQTAPLNPGLVCAQPTNRDPVLSKSPEEIAEKMERWGNVTIVEYTSKMKKNGSVYQAYYVVSDIDCDGKLDLWKLRANFVDGQLPDEALDTYIFYRGKNADSYSVYRRHYRTGHWELKRDVKPSPLDRLFKDLDKLTLNSKNPAEDYRKYLEEHCKCTINPIKVTRRNYCTPSN